MDDPQQDWVTEVTGEPGPDWCTRHGHNKVLSGPLRDVNGHPAAPYLCTVCRKTFFHWVGQQED